MSLFANKSKIPNRIAKTFLGLSVSPSGNFTEDTIHYIAAAPVTKFNCLPAEMVSYFFPEQLVAIFDIANIDKDTTSKTMDYIYGYWLPNSNYIRGQGNDYELFEGVKDESSFVDSSVIAKYIIPVVAK